jgi:hypothetical protein
MISERCRRSAWFWRRAYAIRYAELADAAVAAIMSTNGVIDYCFLSEAMKSLPKLDWLRKGSPLPSGTATARLAAQPARVKRGTSDGMRCEVRLKINCISPDRRCADHECTGGPYISGTKEAGSIRFCCPAPESEVSNLSAKGLLRLSEVPSLLAYRVRA